MIPNAKKFEPGKSGNPGGRPKGLAARAREHTDKALEVLSEALIDADPKVRIVAAKELLDRGYGKSIAMTADVTDKLSEIDDDTLDAAIDVLRAAVGVADEAGGDAGSQTAH